MLSGIVWILTRANDSVRNSWRTHSCLKRMWTYMGVSAIFRIVLLQYIMVLFAGYITMNKQIVQLYNGDIKNIEMTGEFLTFTFMTLTPLLILIPLPCLSKETLR
jgi:drug/metabolite transporter (DMT)-like permease